MTLDEAALSSSGLCWEQRLSGGLSELSVAGVGSRWLSMAPSKGPLDTWLGTGASLAFSSAGEPAVRPRRAPGGRGGRLPGKEGRRRDGWHGGVLPCPARLLALLS